MARVADILADKGGKVQTIDKSRTVFEAIRKMVDANVGSLVVMDGDAISGIITERDYLRRIALQGRTSRETLVADAMTERLIVVDMNREVEDCISIMTSQRIRHLPVIDGNRLAGLVSIGDLMKFLSEKREAEIKYLTDYISNKYPG